MRFRISDVFIPSAAELIDDLWGHELLEGEVLLFSDSGCLQRKFAVVEVSGMPRLLVVPVDRIIEVLP